MINLGPRIQTLNPQITGLPPKRQQILICPTTFSLICSFISLRMFPNKLKIFWAEMLPRLMGITQWEKIKRWKQNINKWKVRGRSYQPEQGNELTEQNKAKAWESVPWRRIQLIQEEREPLPAESTPGLTVYASAWRAGEAFGRGAANLLPMLKQLSHSYEIHTTFNYCGFKAWRSNLVLPNHVNSKIHFQKPC